MSRSTARLLRPGDPIPKGEPRRYRSDHGYIRLFWYVGPKEWVWCYEHRLVAGLPEGREVHHRNHVRDDNSETNLQVVTDAEHGEEHRRIDHAEAARLYMLGVGTPEIAKRLGFTSQAVNRALRRYGVTIRPGGVARRLRLGIDELDVARRLRSGEYPETIARLLGVSANPIRRIQRLHGIPSNPTGASGHRANRGFLVKSWNVADLVANAREQAES